MVKLLIKILKGTGLVSKLLPTLLRMWAEGGLGQPAQKVYIWLAGKKTVTGAILLAAGTGIEAIAASHPEWQWAAPAARWIFYSGALLTSIGLVDAGVRSPWPNGTDIPASVKKAKG